MYLKGLVLGRDQNMWRFGGKDETEMLLVSLLKATIRNKLHESAVELLQLTKLVHSSKEMQWYQG